MITAQAGNQPLWRVERDGRVPETLIARAAPGSIVPRSARSSVAEVHEDGAIRRLEPLLRRVDVAGPAGVRTMRAHELGRPATVPR